MASVVDAPSLAVAAQSSTIAVLLRAPKEPEDSYYNVSEPTTSAEE